MNKSSQQTQPSNVAVELQALTKRVATLETALEVLIVEKKNSGSASPSGKFASIGGIERRPAHEFEKRETPISFEHLGG